LFYRKPEVLNADYLPIKYKRINVNKSFPERMGMGLFFPSCKKYIFGKKFRHLWESDCQEACIYRRERFVEAMESGRLEELCRLPGRSW